MMTDIERFGKYTHYPVFLDFKVNCPRDQWKQYDMQMKFVLNNGQPFPLPCNGCDWLDGSPACEKCTAAITTMFFRNPEMDTANGITPAADPSK
jgi:hypothetical protein